MPSRFLAGYVWLSLTLAALPLGASAQPPTQIYTLEGSDTFRIAGREVHTVMTYNGLEQLSLLPAPRGTNFNVAVRYEKSDGSAITPARATFAMTMTPAGEITDQRDGDPDYLTILNQPFSIQLDAPTMRDLHALAQAVPFDFPSPMTGAPLHGTLRRLPDGSLGGRKVLGIAFTAHGPLQGSLPDRPGLALSGTIAMNGTAYYAYENALLLGLDATLLIDGKVAGPAGSDAVTITYKRVIRPADVKKRGR